MSIALSRKTPSLVLVLGALSAAVAACGGASPPVETPTTQSETAEAPPAEGAPESAGSESAPVDSEAAKLQRFDAMTAPEKLQHMKQVVAPAMAKIFQEANAEEYANFGCATCHGPGAKSGNFTMPSPALPALNKAEMDAHPEVTKFMMERVVPEMAKLLGEQPYNPETHEGFGCYACHTKKE